MDLLINIVGSILFFSWAAHAAVVTPYMGLLQPTIGVDSGLTWETDVNTNATRIDLHNHTPGNGAQIPSTGINISTPLTFNGQSAINLGAASFTQQSMPFPTTLNSLFVGSDGNLYFNDGAGDPAISLTGGHATFAGVTVTGATLFQGNETVGGTLNASGLATFVAYKHSSTEYDTSVSLGAPAASTNYSMTVTARRLIISPSANIATSTVTLPTTAAQYQVASVSCSGINGITTFVVTGGATPLQTPPAQSACNPPTANSGWSWILISGTWYLTN